MLLSEEEGARDDKVVDRPKILTDVVGKQCLHRMVCRCLLNMSLDNVLSGS